MDAKTLRQFYCTNCGETKTFAEDDQRIRSRTCKTCLQGEMKEISRAEDGRLQSS